MIDPDLLAMLRCPLTKAQLQFADESTTAQVNEAIHRGEARDQVDQRVEDPIEGGLVSDTAGLLYPIRDGIPTLIAEQAIRMTSVEQTGRHR